MSLQELVKESVRQGAQLDLASDGTIYSMNPPEVLWGFSVPSHCVPPWKPEHTLILGYGQGQIAACMRKVWGHQLKVTGIDIKKSDWKHIEFNMVIGDAWDYIVDCTTGIFKKKFDYICVDLWDGGDILEIMYTPEFSVRLKEMCKKMVCMNVKRLDMKRIQDVMEDYGGFFFERGDLVSGNVVLWWSVQNEKEKA